MPIRTLALGLALLALAAAPASARLTRIDADPPVLIDLPIFGATGAYLKITGTYEGELDPADAKNAVIADLALAPRTAGKVHYKTTFAILRPAKMAKGNGKIFHDFGNRGNKYTLLWFNDGVPNNDPKSAADFGNGFLMRYGYTATWNGWDGDAPHQPDMMTIDLPVAKNPDGSAITGMVVAELDPLAPDKTRMHLPYAASRTTPDNGTLTMRQHQTDQAIPVAGWQWRSPSEIAFPGPANVEWIYEFTYEAKDPLVMGIGHAATRDFLSFLRHAAKDDLGHPNPLADGSAAPKISAIYSWGRSQGGRVQRDFLRWGFNEDEQGRKVVDGMMPYATGSGGNLWLNYRFSQPTVSAQQHSRRFSHEPELPHTLAVTHDPVTGQDDGVLKSCLASRSCPKFFNIDGESEYWNKSNALHHTDGMGHDLAIDSLAPDHARVYFISSIQHSTRFSDLPKVMPNCQQMSNPLYNGPVFRALAVALDTWVTKGTPPPPSTVPHVADGTLVPPDQVHYPKVPAMSYAGWPHLAPVQFNPAAMNVNVVLDFAKAPPVPTGKSYVTLVPQTDADGNDLAGIRLPYLAAPLGTFTGWNLLRNEYGGDAPDRCDSTQVGSFIPFANTKAERLASGDPRLSIEERYPTKEAYLAALRESAAGLVTRRFLLPEDAERLVARAAQQGFDMWKRNRQDAAAR